MSTGKKRFWSDDEEREICGQTRVEGVSVAQVAQRYAVNANLIHKWLRDLTGAFHVIHQQLAVAASRFGHTLKAYMQTLLSDLEDLMIRRVVFPSAGLFDKRSCSAWNFVSRGAC
jgi:hypothetical protein